MIRYGLSKQDGRILFEPQEEQSSILLMTFDQFQKEKKYPHHLVLEKSIRTARYCKVEIFAECVQGTICIPKKQEEGKEKLIFGFYLNQEGILLVGDEKRALCLNWEDEPKCSWVYDTAPFSAFTAGIFDCGRCFVSSNHRGSNQWI